VLLTLSSILRKAKAWDRACGSFTLAELTMPREGAKKAARSFTDEETGRIIAAASEPFATILAVTAVLGLRIGEVLTLRVGDLGATPLSKNELERNGAKLHSKRVSTAPNRSLWHPTVPFGNSEVNLKLTLGLDSDDLARTNRLDMCDASWNEL